MPRTNNTWCSLYLQGITWNTHIDVMNIIAWTLDLRNLMHSYPIYFADCPQEYQCITDKHFVEKWCYKAQLETKQYWWKTMKNSPKHTPLTIAVVNNLPARILQSALHTKYCGMKIWFRKVKSELQMHEKASKMHANMIFCCCCCEWLPSLNYTTKLCSLLNTNIDALHPKNHGTKT